MPADKDRADRLAAALRANLGRRKDQARARKASDGAAPGENGAQDAIAGSAAHPKGKAKIVPDGEPG